jgi:ElaB/YqjD/DUF883 family membrane-anchored ribosome-binding protein
MDPGTLKLVIQLSTYGPLGIMVVIFFSLFMLSKKEMKELRMEHKEELKVEQNRVKETSDKLESISLTMIQSTEQQTAAVNALTKVLDSIDRRLA